MPSAFAPELFALIVDNLHDDIDSLKSCALSASILHEPSQRLLFSSHSLAIRNVERCRGLSSLLSHSPHISTYITTLVLLSPPRVANNENWFETDTIVGTLQDLLPKFTHIRRCVWQRETRDGMVTNWTVMVRSYTLILECLARQPLRELHLRYLPFLTPMSVVLQLLSMAPTISFPTIVFWDGADIIPIPRQHPLRRLGVHSMSVVDLLLQPGLSLELSTVQDLGITIDEQVENVVEPLIAAVARTLRTLLVRITQWGGPPLVLPPCLSLEVAELLIGVDYFYDAQSPHYR
ncbi:hypothetical protein C8F01DRAFT_1127564 [Mycena amicta]|nr:hypothetical protein C8F01DRAFT_1127564 [Mycena amicta]